MGGEHHFGQKQKPVSKILAHFFQGCDQPLVQQLNRVGSFRKEAFCKLDDLPVVAVVYGLMKEIKRLHANTSLSISGLKTRNFNFKT